TNENITQYIARLINQVSKGVIPEANAFVGSVEEWANYMGLASGAGAAALILALKVGINSLKGIFGHILGRATVSVFTAFLLGALASQTALAKKKVEKR